MRLIKPKKPELSPLVIRRIEGTSMWPTLEPGRLVLGRRWFRRVRPGDVIMFRHQGLEKVKRVQQVEARRLFVVGDNPDTSTDSRHFGWIEANSIVAKVIQPNKNGLRKLSISLINKSN